MSGPAPSIAGQTSLPSTPQELLAADPRALVTTLKTLRLEPVSLDDKRRILESLPVEGVVTELSGKLQHKLIALEPLLRAVDRGGVFDVRVVDIRLARVGLFQRTVLLISRTALALLSAPELRAQVAHEIAHEYFAVEHERATAVGDHRRLKEIELMCDAIGITILHELGMNPARLIVSIEKVTLYNRRMSQIGMDESNYPTLDERRQFAVAVRRWIEREREKESRLRPERAAACQPKRRPAFAKATARNLRKRSARRLEGSAAKRRPRARRDNKNRHEPVSISRSGTRTHKACCQRPAHTHSLGLPTIHRGLTW